MSAKKPHLPKLRLRLESLERRELLAAEIGAQALEFSSDGLWAATGELHTVEQISSEVTAENRSAGDRHLFLMDPSRFYRALSQVDANGLNSQVVNLPSPDGGFDSFSITSLDTVNQVYLGRGVNNDTLQVQLQMSGAHFRAQVISPEAQYGIDQLYEDDMLLYSSYHAADSNDLPQFVDYPDVPYSAVLDTGNIDLADIDPETLQGSGLMLAPGLPVIGDALAEFHDQGFVSEGENDFAEFTFNDNRRWSITASDGGGLTQGDATTLTWSIVPDGTSIPGRNGTAAANSDLVAFLGGIYGVTTDDTNYEDESWFLLFEDYLDRWSDLTGINYVYEPADDGLNFQSARGQLGVRGDMRISGRSVDGQDGANVLAYNFFPNNGDMVIDTDNVLFYSSMTNNSRALRNVLSHENGHGLGIGHVCPVIRSEDGRLMEPFINTRFDGPQFDDVLVGQRGYGDSLEKNGGNDTTATATDLGLVAEGTTVSVGADVGLGPQANRVAPTESDFISIDDDSDIDVYAFSLSDFQQLTVTLMPVGPSYLSGPQNADGTCSAGTNFDASSQSDLQFEIIDADGVTIRNVSAANGLGLSEALVIDDIDAGDYFVRVSGNDNAAQMYQLDVQAELRIGEVIYTPSENLIVSENGLQDSYTISLDRPAAGNVQFEITAGPDLEISLVNGAFGTTQAISLDGTNSVEIIVRAVDDTLPEGIHFDTISHEIVATDDPVVFPVGLPADPVTVQIYDDEGAPLQRVDPLGGLISRSTENTAVVAELGVGQAAVPITYEVFVQAGQTLSAISTPESGVQVDLTVTDPSGNVLGTSASQNAGDIASLDLIPILADGVYTISVTTDLPGLLNTEWYLNAALEVHYGDSGIVAPVAIDGSAINHAGLAADTNRFAAIGQLVDSELTGGSAVDVYQVGMTAGNGKTSDIVLTAIDGDSLAGASLELIDVDGTGVLASGTATAAGSNFDLAILDFEIPTTGSYSVRVSTNTPLKYSLVVNESSLIDTEPNAIGGGALRTLDGDAQLIGYLHSVNDTFDSVDALLQIGQTVDLSVTTLFPQPQPLVNDLQHGLFVVRPGGQVDIVNSGTTYTAVDDGVHELFVHAISGSGEYALDVGLETLVPLTLTIDELQISENGGVTNATISRIGDLSSPVTVSVGNSDSSEADAPTEIVIPAEQATSAPFQINGVDDFIADGVQFVTFRATAPGYRFSSETVAVLDDEPPELAVTIDVSEMSENGGVALGTVSRVVFPASDVEVFLQSDDLTEAAVPNSVIIPAGEFSATFPITAVDDLISDGTQTVSISATNVQFVSGQTTIDVLDDEGSISGRKFSDDNGNGSLDPGELPLAGWTIFLDHNNDGDIDAGSGAEPDEQLPVPASDPDPVINTAYAGVTLSAVGIDSGSGNVLSTAVSNTAPNTRVFGHDGGTVWNDLEVRLRAEFETPKDFFSLDYISNGGEARVQVFDVDGVVVDELRTNFVPAGTVETISLRREENDIAFIIAGGFSSGTGQLDNLVFGTDEPSTVTDAQGRYLFSDLETGRSYNVREIQQDGWVQTSPTVSAAPPTLPAPVTQNVEYPYTDTEVIASIQLTAGQTIHQFLLNATSQIDTELASIIAVEQSRELFSTADDSVVLVALKSGVDPLSAVEKLSSIDSVQWVTPNHVYDFDGFELTPDDPDFGNQYHHVLMESELAWNTTLGDPSIIVGVTDNGVDLDHEDLVDNIWLNEGEIAGNGIDDDNNGFIDDVNGWDFIDQDNDPNPNGNDDHGTHVSGIIGGRTDNSTGIAGVAGGATILPLKFAGSANGNGLTAAIFAEAYTYAIDNGAHIVNTSFNVNAMANNPAYLAGLDYFYDNGGLHFNSAGNASEYNPVRQSMDQSLFVASTTAQDTLSVFSNYGHGIDVAAPGSAIYATLNDDTYGTKSGTSMAAPNAAGVAALIWSANPGWTRDQVAAQLIGMVDNIDANNPGFEGLLGPGRVNAGRSVSQLLSAPQLRRLVGLPQNFESTLDALTGFAVDFENVFDPGSVDDEDSWELLEAGFDGVFDTADDVRVPFRADTQYAVGTNRLSFTFDNGALEPGAYRFTAFASGLEDPFGQPLDGNRDGNGGDDLTRFFQVTENQLEAAHVVTLIAGDARSDLDFLNRPPTDFGDAPVAQQSNAPSFVSDYPTLLKDDGARHLLTGPILGTARDAEPDGLPTVLADGDDLQGDNTDDDGITFPSGFVFSSFESESPSSIAVQISNASSDGNYLDGWIDFNRDGDWTDVGEKIISGYDLGTSSGSQIVDFTIPRDVGDNVETGATYARFRVSTDSSGLEPTGYTDAGEVEDYAIEVQNPMDLVVSEIMVAPGNGSPDWQWVEVYNKSDFQIDLQGFVLDSESGPVLSESNITTGAVPANSAAVLYNDSISRQDFQAAWGNIASLIPVSNWSTVSGGEGTIGLWKDLNAYDDRTFENALDSVSYFDDANGWPDLDSGASIALNDIDADNNVGSNWNASRIGVSGAYANRAESGNAGGEIGSPGFGIVNRVNQLERLKTLGSYIAISRDNRGTVLSDVDHKDYVVMLDAGETVTAEAISDGSAKISLQWLGSGQEKSISAPGRTINTPMYTAQSSGFHTVRVRADRFSDFTLDVAVNAVLESSVGDSGDANERSIDATRHRRGTGSFFGAIGNSDPVFGSELVLSHENDPGQFIDISQTGTQAYIFNGTSRQIQTTVGNSLFPAGTVTISDDGTLASGTASPTSDDNLPLPAVPFNTALFPFWDSLIGTRLVAPNVYYQETIVDGVETLIVQWDDAEHTANVGDPIDGLTFQVQVFDSNTTLAKFAYRDVEIGNPLVDNGASATIGLMTGAANGLEYSRNESSVVAGDVITLAVTSGPDVDEYEIDLSEFTGETVDIVLTSTSSPNSALSDRRFRAQSLELLDRDGATVLATGNAGATNADLAILGYVVPRNGIYTVRLTSSVTGEYTLSVSESLTIEIEDNGRGFEANPRVISPTRLATGYIGNGQDDLDYFQFSLQAGQTIQVETETPHDSFLNSPTNMLDATIELTRVNFPIDLLAGDNNSAADGRNALFNFTAPADGQYLIRVIPYAGEGEYLLHLRDIQTPLVTEVVVNNGADQRSIVTELDVHFNSEVVAPEDAFEIRNRDTGTVVDGTRVTSSVVDGRTIAQITFTSGPFVDSRGDSFGESLVDGNYELRVFGSQVRSVVNGTQLPADFRFGDSKEDAFFRLFGDSDGNRKVDGRDFGNFGLSFLKSPRDVFFEEYFDHDGDGTVSGRDYGLFGLNFYSSLRF